ncbi:hypothetical protein [Phenylobacterium sp.]|uniref:hypothetical protein n=1 Tax=Phenylobacterium sp. TaxID=1871053 RepID=UPI002732DAE1|nr:hypothetical protein [Phenylobacterium sp.]MDP3854309.1 hypothetical protein [Phenylobacterium sp.]
MADPNEPHVEKTITEGPATVRREEVRTVGATSSGSNAGWWIAALVAIVAIVGLFFVFNTGTTDEGDLMAARESGRSEAMIDSATADAQAAAVAATESSRQAASGVATATRSAADSASAAAERSAQAAESAAVSAGDAAADAAATTEPPR